MEQGVFKVVRGENARSTNRARSEKVWELLTYRVQNNPVNLSLANRAAKKYMSLSLIKAATIISVNIQTYSVWLQNVRRGWTVQAMARLETCTM